MKRSVQKREIERAEPPQKTRLNQSLSEPIAIKGLTELKKKKKKKGDWPQDSHKVNRQS
jgi:hypothetical protein